MCLKSLTKHYHDSLAVPLLVLLALSSNLALAEEMSEPIEALSVQQANEAPVVEEKFDIFEYQVEGNSKLTNVEIETAVYPFLGEKRTFTDVRKAREALEKAYHQAGYLTVLVDIPEQEVANKVVKLSVTESKIGKLRIKDSDYYSLGRIKISIKSKKILLS
jgi:hemolysin activation/secretion protein